jgi:hypothetical protein
MSPIFNLASGYIQSLFGSTSGSSASNSTTTSTTGSSSGGLQGPGGLSEFAQVLNSIQQLQQANPSLYAQDMSQISGNLQTAAQSATTNGDSRAASELNQLSTDFKNASTSGQLPSLGDLAQAVGGRHHHGHAFHAFQTSGLSASGLSASAPGTNSGFNPLTIIENTLSTASA